MFDLLFAAEAEANLKILEGNPGLLKRFKSVCKALGYLASNPRHPSLSTHEYTSLSAKLGSKVFEAYAENQTPGAYRIFWCYGPGRSHITVLAVTAHP